ncbi:hypothetical protein JCM15124A_12960 [Prevotella falsenii]
MKRENEINKSYLYTSMSFKDMLVCGFPFNRARNKTDRLVLKANNTTILKASN